MGKAEQDFKNASIRFDSYVPGPNESGVRVFSIEGSKGITFFEVKFEFAENGNDFWVVISNFGIPSVSAAGSGPGIVQRKFNDTEAESARERLEEYFNGPEEKRFGPFGSSRATFLGVKYESGWINDNSR